jgi:two-component system osmolarity sensor histidine kinase EnvZ
MRIPRPGPRVFWRFLKRLTPTSLFGRSLLIIVLPIALMQIAVTYVFFDAHWQTVNSHLTEGLAGDVALVQQTYQEDPTPASLARLRARAQTNLGLSIEFKEGGVLPRGRRASLFVAVDRSLNKALKERIDGPFWFDTGRYPAYVDVRVRVSNGVLRIIAPKDRVFATRGHIFFWMTPATVLLTAISILFIRNQVRAIERLAYAADAFGRGDDVAFRPHGAREVRLAARAFLAMKARIQRHVDQRTILLAAVSHDLRTPLTRLRLELAMSPPGPRVTAMKADLAEMEHMIDDYLAFARGEGGEGVETVSVADLLEKVRAGASLDGVVVEVEAPADLTARVRPGAFRRALTNLVANAVSHAARVKIDARPQPGGGVEIHIDDNGPGLSPDHYDEAFALFTRVGPASGLNVKGVGLGLAIARDVARGHGGDVVLGASPLGGLRATVTLP